MAFPRDCDVIIAIGSGTLNDLCKFSSFQLGLDYMIFATAPSMDGFVSIGAALITDYVKTTYQAHVPLAVIGDTDILAAGSDGDDYCLGLGDILGKYTCLLDWKMAHIITRGILLQDHCGYGKRSR
ncbi:MAG: iron-containing alcohol dehydrogenase [Anaerobutyricum sp.]